jgi:HEAT repeat protein
MTGIALVLALLPQADEAAAQQALEKFRFAYAKPDASVRAAAVAELAATRHDLVLRKLAVLLLTDEKEIRVAAARGLSGFEGHKKRAAAALAGGMDPNAKQPDVLAAILQALGTLREEESLPSIHKCLRRRETAVALAAVAAVEAIQCPERSVDPMVEALRGYEKTVKMADADAGGGGAGGLIAIPGGGDEVKHARELRARIIKAFQKWTGERWPTAGEWEGWWERQKKKGALRKKGCS